MAYNTTALRRYVKHIISTAIDKGKNAEGSTLQKILDDTYNELKIFIERDD